MANAYVRPNVAASGTTWAQLLSGGLSGTLLRSLAAQPQPGTPNTAPSVAPTVAATVDAASTLPTATYYAQATETNGFGETTPSPASSGQAVTAGTNHLTVTPAALQTGNTANNIYIRTGATGPFILAAAGVTGATGFAVPLPANSWAAATPPAANTTALSAQQIELIRAAANGDVRRVVRHAIDVLRDYLRGDPQAYGDAIARLGEADAAIAVLYKVLGEIGALVVANPGTIGAGPLLGNTFPRQRRTWP